jgi:hypothetical protein
VKWASTENAQRSRLDSRAAKSCCRYDFSLSDIDVVISDEDEWKSQDELLARRSYKRAMSGAVDILAASNSLF